MPEPAPGDQIDQYQLEELVARSGMASIFKARDTLSGETVALKIPHMQCESDVVFLERFQREEEICQRPLPQARALAIAQQICEALVYPQEHGVVPRDLKPEIVLLTADRQIKILD